MNENVVNIKVTQILSYTTLIGKSNYYRIHPLIHYYLACDGIWVNA